MVLDHLQHANKYFEMSEGIKKGLQFLQNANFSELEDGRHDIEGDKVFVNIMSYETKENPRYEAHHQYIDIQYIVEGEGEKIGYLFLEQAGEAVECKPESDYCLYDKTENNGETACILKRGMFAIFMPQDAHRPGCSLGNPAKIRKAVVKVRVE